MLNNSVTPPIDPMANKQSREWRRLEHELVATGCSFDLRPIQVPRRILDL